MKADLELDEWREQWQSETSIPPDLRYRVERHSRLMKIGLICDAVVTVVMGGGTTTWALMSANADVWTVAVATWFFLAAAWAFVLTVNRGLWSPSALEASAFVDLSIRRCRSALSTTWFAVVLFLAEIVFGLSWAYLHSLKEHSALLPWLLFGSVRIDIVWVLTIAFLGAVAWYRKRKLGELARLVDLRAQMIDPSANEAWSEKQLLSEKGSLFTGTGKLRRKRKRTQS